MPAAQVQFSSFQFGPNLTLCLDDSKKSWLTAFLDGLDGLCERLPSVQVQNRHPLRLRAGLWCPPLLNGVRSHAARLKLPNW